MADNYDKKSFEFFEFVEPVLVEFAGRCTERNIAYVICVVISGDDDNARQIPMSGGDLTVPMKDAAADMSHMLPRLLHQEITKGKE